MFKNYNINDLGKATLNEDINASATTFGIREEENLPTTNFTLTLRVLDSNGDIVKNERIYVTTRSGNTLSGVVRGYAGTTAKAFSDGDIMSLNIIAEHIIDIQEELGNKASLSSNNFTGTQDFAGLIRNHGKNIVDGSTAGFSTIKSHYGNDDHYGRYEMFNNSLERAGYIGYGNGGSYFGLYGDNADDFIFSGLNVGVGTTVPGEKLDVFGRIQSRGPTVGMIIDYTGTYTGGKAIFSIKEDGIFRWGWGHGGTESGSNTGSNFFLFRYSDAGGLLGTALSVLRDSGNVGMGGVVDPTENLHTYGNIRIGNSNSVDIGHSSGYVSGNNVGIMRSNGGGTGIWAEAGHLILQPRGSTSGRHTIFMDGGGTETMRIQDGGRLALGKTTATSEFDMWGALTIDNNYDSCIKIQESGSLRWNIGKSGGESSSNAGSDFTLYRYSDTGGYLGSAFKIKRSDGTLTIPGQINTGVSSWTALVLSNGWLSFGSSYATPRYYKNATGEVELQCMVKSGTSAVVGTLPVGYRPSRSMIYSIRDGIGNQRVTISSTGTITLGTGYSTVWAAINITFSTR